MQVVVTGANTFIGGHVVRELSSRGHEVYALVQPQAKEGDLEAVAAHVQCVDLRGTGDRPKTQIAEAIGAAEGIIHCDLVRRESRSWRFNETNPVIFRNLLRAAAHGAPACKRVVLLSSLSALGPRIEGQLMREDNDYRPNSYYGKSLRDAERVADEFREHYEVTIVRMPVVYGPGDTEALALFRMVLSGHLYSVIDPQIILSLCYAEDFARGMVDALEHADGGNEIFHFASNVKPRLLEIVHAIEDALGCSAKVHRLPRALGHLSGNRIDSIGRVFGVYSGIGSARLKEYLHGHWACRTKHAQRVLGWKPKTNFREGIRDTAQWYLEHGLLKRPDDRS